MQRALLVLALLAAPIAASSVSASSAASAWLQSHKSPTDNQLGELANANPAAFAIVQALLSKHAKHAQLAAEDRGPDVFRRMMSEGSHHVTAAEPKVALPYATAELAEVRAPVVDQAHYNVKTASDRDESAVDRLLNAVASMGGAKGKKIALLRQKHRHGQVTSNLLDKDADLFGGEGPPAPTPVRPAVEVAQVMEEATAVPQKKENSYLKGIDLSGDMPEVVAKHGAHKKVVHDDSPNSLATFSFDDSAPAAAVPKKVFAALAPKKDNSFLNWLGLVKKAPAPKEQPVAPAKKENSYLAKFMA